MTVIVVYVDRLTSQSTDWAAWAGRQGVVIESLRRSARRTTVALQGDLPADTAARIAQSLPWLAAVEMSDPLATAKAMRYLAIDQRTLEVLGRGLEHEGARYAARPESLMLYTQAYVMRGALSYPLRVGWIADDGASSFNGPADVKAWGEALALRVQAIHDEATDLKEQVRAATTVGAVLAVADDRLLAERVLGDAVVASDAVSCTVF